MMSVPGIPGNSSESLPTATSKPTETEMNPLREIASVMMVRQFKDPDFVILYPDSSILVLYPYFE